MMRLCKHQLQ